MFFAAVGIIILFASFIIALISLVREQQKQDQRSASADDEADTEAKVVAPVVVEAPKPLEVAIEERVDEVRDEAFPWEADGTSTPDEIKEEPRRPIVVQQRGKLQGEISLRSLTRTKAQ